MPSVEQAALAQRIGELGERAAAGTGLEVVEIDLRGSGRARLLRAYIDKPGGVTHADCELISTKLGQLLDEEDVIPGDSYTLEVSSPGVERKLTKPRDFERVVGQKLRVALRQPVNGLSHLEGKLTAFADQTLAIETASGDSLRLPLDQVRKANLKFEW